MNYTDITATEGDSVVSFAFDIYIEKEKLSNTEVLYRLYHVINGMKILTNIIPVIRPKATFSCPNPDPLSCQCTIQSEVAHIYEVTLPNPTPANDGIYLLEVTVDSRNFSASITLSGNIFNISI